MNYNDFDLIITTSTNKKYLLKNANTLNKTKIMTPEVLTNSLYGTFSPASIRFVCDTFKVIPSVALKYLANALFIPNLLDDLKSHNLWLNEPFNYSIYHHILIYEYPLIDPYLLNTLKKYYDVTVYNEKSKNDYPKVLEFVTEDDEYSYLATQIISLFNRGISLDAIKIVGLQNDNFIPFKRIMKNYHIPYSLNENKSIYKTKSVQLLLNGLKENLSIGDLIGELKHDAVYNKIIDILNIYGDDYEILNEIFKNTYLSQENYQNVITTCNINDIQDDDNYYFIVNFNEDNLPKIFKDEDYLSDATKKSLGLLTSYEKNKITKDIIKTKITLPKNIQIMYSLSNPFSSFMPSPLINELNIPIEKNLNIPKIYSKTQNVLKLGQKLDKLYKYNEYDDLSDLYATYGDFNYLSYNNKYTGINLATYHEFINNNILLSYSSLDNYYKCSFRYYLQNVLKVEKREETFAIKIGNLFHLCLSKMYDKDFDLDTLYTKYVQENITDAKELFFIKKLKNDLLFIIDTIHEQESNSSLNNTLTEQKIFIDLSKDIKISFMGIIDKLKYADFPDGRVAAIIDYKTGNLETCLDNINYGLHMQLPLYIYLAKNNFKNVEVAGFYLQKILNNEKIDTTLEDKKASLKLDGFSNSDETILAKFDSTYESSRFVKGLRKSSKGWYAYAKVINDVDINTIASIAETNINNAAKEIENADFKINPKRINNLNEGCNFCHFHDICYRREEDIIDLENCKIKDILGGDDNANMD
jgi:ATP-dependent helicase/DNAse subunit B